MLLNKMCKVKTHKEGCSCHPPSQLGKIRSQETRFKLSLSHRTPRPWRMGVPLDKNRGSKHFAWKGDDVGYEALHAWIHRVAGKADRCCYDNCSYPRKNADGVLMVKPKRFEWANISKKYKRDLSDWTTLCASCHRKYDMGKISL